LVGARDVHSLAPDAGGGWVIGVALLADAVTSVDNMLALNQRFLKFRSKLVVLFVIAREVQILNQHSFTEVQVERKAS
jgi:hypothetical protein